MKSFENFVKQIDESIVIRNGESLYDTNTSNETNEYRLDNILLENGCNLCLFNGAGMEPDNRPMLNPDIRNLKGVLGSISTLQNTKAGYLIDKAARMFSEHMVNKDFDIIGTIKTTKENMAGDLVDKLDFSDGRTPMVLKNLVYLVKSRNDIKTTSDIADKKLNRLFRYGDFDIEKIGKDEKANIKGFIGVNPSLENKVMGKNIAIIDDYAETGTTLREACEALLKCGAKSVSGYAIKK